MTYILLKAPSRLNVFQILAYTVFILCAFQKDLNAQRVSTFAQVQHPHDYYYKELYLPQLTSGPSSLCWSPDSQELIYSMGGSLWRQDIQKDTAFQLTDSDGYDYQPDWSPDGKQLIFSRYNGRSLELILLDLDSGKESELTNNQGVNVEARWSPDGTEIAFVSTMQTGHFLIYKAGIQNAQLQNLTCLTPDRESVVSRYYYGSWDHAISPSWSPDGQHIYFISNREVAHGSGDLLRLDLDDPSRIRLIRREETSWRGRPDIAPDNSRMVYASYLGGNWHQLWLLPAEGGYPFPLTYGEYDNTSPRWSPDGNTIAFISNRTGNTSIWLVDAYDGGQQLFQPGVLLYQKARQLLKLKIVDEKGQLSPARISIIDSKGKTYAPYQAWIHGDDSFYEGEQKFETHYFHTNGICSIPVPRDTLFLQVSHGPLYEIEKKTIDVTSSTDDPITIVLRPLQLKADFGSWWAGDLHIHMNYGGNYRNVPEKLLEQGRAEDLQFMFNLIVNKEQRIPDVDYFRTEADPESTNEIILLHAQEFHTSFWGHLGILNLNDHLILPDYVGYPYTAVASIFPHNGFIADRAHQQNALVGYVHPFLDMEIFPRQAETLKNELPLDAALGKVDYYELVGFAHHRASEHVWYQLLNCGLHIAAGAGTDAMANYASLRGPVGLNRVFVKAEGAFNKEQFIRGLKSGRSFVTNGPIINLKINDAQPGDTVQFPGSEIDIKYDVWLSSATPVENLELIYNGEVLKRFEIKDHKIADASGIIKLSGPGWLLLRAWNEDAEPDILDYYPYASTNPIYVLPKGGSIRSKSGGAYFLPWIDRIEKAVMSHESFRHPKEKEIILADIKRARAFYQNCVDHPTIE